MFVLKIKLQFHGSHVRVIKQDNCKLLGTKNVYRLCNYRNKDNCPLDVKSLQTFIIYKVDVIPKKISYIFYGGSDRESSRYNNHKNLFCYRHRKRDSELSKHIWELQHKNINFTLKWSIPSYASIYKFGLKRCDL